MGKVKTAAVWSIIDKFGAQIVSFVIGIVLARLLSPEDYGLVGLAGVFIAFSGVFIECGFGNALVRKIDRTPEDLHTAFTFNVIIGLVVYLLLFFSAPFFSDWFEAPLLVPILRVIGLNVVFNSLSVVPMAILTASLRIKHISIINMAGQIPMGIVAIALAFNGFGVYSLAVQSVGAAFVAVSLAWVATKWLPCLCLNKDSLRYLWGFGSKLLSANIVGVIFNEIYTVLIGKYVGKTDLGYYSKGRSLALNPNSLFVGVVQRIAVPVLSEFQSDLPTLRERFKEYNSLLSFLATSLYAILFVSADGIIFMLWGDKWMDCVLLFRLMLIVNLFSPGATISLAFLQVVNRTDCTLRQEFLKKPIALVLILITIRWGIIALLCGQIVSSFAEYIISFRDVRKLLHCSYLDVLGGSLKYVAVAIFAAVGCFLLRSVLPIQDCIISSAVAGVLCALVIFTTFYFARDAVFFKLISLIPCFKK